jgi:hypothetical protein
MTLIFKFSVSDDSENVTLREQATTKQTARQTASCKLITEIILMFQGNTVEGAYYNHGCYQSAIVIKISGPKTLHLKSIKNKPFIIINLSVIVIKLQIIGVYI